MKITVLGCSGSMPGPDSPASGYLVEHDGVRIVLDLGNGAFGALQRYAAPRDVDAIVLSHLHADHCIDMTAYYVALRYGPQRPTHRIPLIGPAGTRDRLTAAYDPMVRKLGLQELFDFRTPERAEIGGLSLSFTAMNHPVPTNAVRVSAGERVLVYSGDTGVSDPLVSLAHGADLLLCEATFLPGEPYVDDLHLTARQAGEHAARAGVGRLVVTHVPPWGARETQVTEAAAVFDGVVEAAQPGAVFTV